MHLKSIPRKTLLLAIALFVFLQKQKGLAQANVNYSPDYYHIIDRLEILNKKTASQFFGINKPYNRKEIAEFISQTDSTADSSHTKANIYNVQFLKNDNWEWLAEKERSGTYSKKKLWKLFFEHKADAYSAQNPDYDIHISPVFYFHAGRGADTTFWQNSRGIEIRGNISKKLSFYTQITDNQAVLPAYLREYTAKYDVVPGESHYNPFGKLGQDYYSARGYVTLQALKPVALTFGHDKSFTGIGYRSMLQSDFAPPVLFFRINTKIGKVQYQNQYSQLANYYKQRGQFNTVIPKKYMVSHQLNIKIGRGTELGLVENIVLSRQTDIDLSYLNPVIFYRFVEAYLGSPDNAMAAAQFRHITKKNLSVYGQLMFDELTKSKLINEKGNFGNKFSYQLGIKTVDFLKIKNLDIQAEYNHIRPYTYSHFSNYSNYVHYNQALAHPMGANLREWLLVARYQPLPKLTLVATYVHTMKGEDYDQRNWGGNILLDYDIRVTDNQNLIGQGLKTNHHYTEARASYQLAQSLFLDASIIYKAKLNVQKDVKNTYPSLTFRWNMPYKSYAL
jgi:hypothetical protein